MKHHHVPKDIQEIAKNLFCCFKTSMLTDGFVTDFVHMEKGVLQRDCFSPLKEMRNSFKNWPLNLWWISSKAIMEVVNIVKAAFLKKIFHLSLKIHNYFLVTVLFNIFREKNVNWLFWGVTQKYELRVSFNVQFEHQYIYLVC